VCVRAFSLFFLFSWRRPWNTGWEDAVVCMSVFKCMEWMHHVYQLGSVVLSAGLHLLNVQVAGVFVFQVPHAESSSPVITQAQYESPYFNWLLGSPPGPLFPTQRQKSLHLPQPWTS
jgi:hypothetical protein